MSSFTATPPGALGRVLLIDDDPNIVASLGMYLRQDGYGVSEAGSGEEGLSSFAATPANVVLVDLLLPGADGLEVTRSLRSCSDVPVIVVSACAGTPDIIAGLEAGADDYVTKPVVPKELSARIRAHMRRAQLWPNEGATVIFGALEIRLGTGVARKDGEELALTRTEFRLLCELASRPGWVMSRPKLLERVWGYDYFGDTRLVDVHVGRLRSKIEADPARPALVVTVRGAGYKFERP